MTRTNSLWMTLMALAVTSVTASAQPTAAAATTAAQGANDAKLSAQKTEAAKGVDELGKLAQEMVDSLFRFGEPGVVPFAVSRARFISTRQSSTSTARK